MYKRIEKMFTEKWHAVWVRVALLLVDYRALRDSFVGEFLTNKEVF